MTLQQRLIHLGLKFLGVLPLSVLRMVALPLGAMASRFKGRTYRIVDTNLELCFPELSAAQRRQLVQHRLQQLGTLALEMAKAWSISNSKVLALVKQVENRELFEKELALGKGVITLGPHVGNWEVAGMYLASCHDTVANMYQPPKQRSLENLIRSAREKTGAKMVPTNRSGVSQLLKALRQGDVIGVLPDQVPDDSGGVFAPFFGHPALTMTLVSNLARKTGARIICLHAIPCKGGYHLKFSEPDARVYSNELSESVAGVNASVENCARQHPEHYQWEYKRFKRQPAGYPNIYEKAKNKN